MMCFHGMMRHCEAAVNAKVKEGAPLPADFAVQHNFEETRKAWSRRAAAFVHKPSTPLVLLAFIRITQPIMHLHYKLFKDGKHIRRPSVQSSSIADAENIPTAAFQFADMNTSPALSVLGELYDLMLPDSEAKWKVMVAIQPLEAWPEDDWFAVRCALLAVIGNTYRRLYTVFDAWPWRLCAIYNPEIPMQDREEAAREFLACSPCCLDPGFARKLQLRCKTVAELFEPRMVRFVMQFLNSIFLTTATLECGFPGPNDGCIPLQGLSECQPLRPNSSFMSSMKTGLQTCRTTS